jgi:Mg2+ and Co2+ transporter CorA
MLISALKDYESIMNEIESQQDAIVSLQDDIADKQYEISEKIYEETRKEAEKLLNKFKIEIEVDLNEAEMMRKIDRLRAKVANMPSWDLASAMGLDQADAISYATKDVNILTGAVNKLITDYQSDAWKDFYDT